MVLIHVCKGHVSSTGVNTAAQSLTVTHVQIKLKCEPGVYNNNIHLICVTVKLSLYCCTHYSPHMKVGQFGFGKNPISFFQKDRNSVTSACVLKVASRLRLLIQNAVSGRFATVRCSWFHCFTVYMITK